MSRHPDAGLRAVARIREVQERDSRLEVRDARLEQARAATVLDELQRALRAPVPDAAFAAGRTALLGLTEPTTRARAELLAAQARSADAVARWQQARSRLAAVEGLLERRADARAAEARRVEARELDDVAGRLREARRREQRHDTTPEGEVA